MSEFENRTFCDACGSLINDVSVTTLSGVVCEDCARDMYSCECCGGIDDSSHLVPVHVDTIDDDICEYYCRACLRESTHIVQCHCCGEYFDYDYVEMTSLYGSDDCFVCHSCRQENCTQCADCGEWIYTDDANYDDNTSDDFCEYCWNRVMHDREEENSIIHDYHKYDTDWIFRGKDEELHFGIELEIERGGEYDDNAISITTAMGYPCDKSNEIRVSHDGSLNSGFEIISNPYTYEYHMNGIDWIAGLKKARKLDYVSHDGGHCGIHFHVDVAHFRKQGYKTREQLEDVIAVLMLNNMDWLKRFSRRKNWYYCQFPNVDRNTALHSLSPRTYFRDKGKYCAANFWHNDTIEFRFIRGTLIPETFIAALQLINLIGKALSTHRTIKTIVQIGSPWFLETARVLGYHEFIQEYFKRCTAVVNDSVNDDEEDVL